MSFEYSNFESEPEAKIGIEPGLDSFVPEEFKQNPIAYFEHEGQNIKTRETERDESGRVTEDPTAVKEFPVWTDQDDRERYIIGKRVNPEKGNVGESGDPFYEYKVMKLVTSLGLPTPRPVAKVEQQGTHLILMEKAQGIGWYEKEALKLKNMGYTNEELYDLKNQAVEMMTELQQRFEEAGISRDWKLEDMIVDIDIENKKVRGMTPTDWERTQIDAEKLEQYRKGIQS